MTEEPPSTSVEELVRLHHPDVLRLCRYMTDNEAEAADLAQEVCFKVLRSPDRYDRARPFRVWILQIARNTVVDHLRRRGKWRSIERDVAPPAATSDPVLREESHDRLRRAVRRLPEPYRMVVIYTVWEGFTPMEIADMLGIPAGRVRVQLFRALKLLEKEVGHGSASDR